MAADGAAATTSTAPVNAGAGSAGGAGGAGGAEGAGPSETQWTELRETLRSSFGSKLDHDVSRAARALVAKTKGTTSSAVTITAADAGSSARSRWARLRGARALGVLGSGGQEAEAAAGASASGGVGGAAAVLNALDEAAAPPSSRAAADVAVAAAKDARAARLRAVSATSALRALAAGSVDIDLTDIKKSSALEAAKVAAAKAALDSEAANAAAANAADMAAAAAKFASRRRTTWQRLRAAQATAVQSAGPGVDAAVASAAAAEELEEEEEDVMLEEEGMDLHGHLIDTLAETSFHGEDATSRDQQHDGNRALTAAASATAFERERLAVARRERAPSRVRALAVRESAAAGVLAEHARQRGAGVALAARHRAAAEGALPPQAGAHAATLGEFCAVIAALCSQWTRYANAADLVAAHAACEGDVARFADTLFRKEHEAHVLDSFGFARPISRAMPTRPPPQRARPEIQLGAFAMPRWDWQPGATRGRRLPHPSEVPRRIRYRPCRTLVFPPAGWDARRAIARSSRPPSAQLELEWIHGYEIGLCGMVSANLCCVAAATPGEPRAERRLVFAAAAVIVVFDLGGLLDTEPTKDDGGDGDGLPTPPTSQRYFRGHDDNVTCVTLNATGTLGVSGQVGARPVVLVWDVVTLEQTHAFGRGFYQAGIAVLFFSPDDALVAAVGSDVNHTLGVWRLETRGEGVAVGALRLGEKTAETLDRAAVYGGCWMARKGFALNRGVPLGDESEKVEDTFVTVGYGKHVRFWELQQPDEAGTSGPPPASHIEDCIV